MRLMHEHGPAMVFIGVMVESIIIPLPSPLIIMGAGVIIIPPTLTWTEAFWPICVNIVVPGAIAETLGAFIAFGVGVWGGERMIKRFSGWLGFSWADVGAMERRLGNGIGPALVLLRAIPIVPLSLISAAAGVLRVPVGQFTLWTFLGSVPRCLLLGYLGFLTRDAYEGLAKQIDKMEALVSAGLVIGAIGILFWIRRRMARPATPS